MSIIKFLGSSNFFSISKPLVKILGFQTTGILQEIISKYEWHKSHASDFNGLYWSQDDMAQEFNISRKTVARVIEFLATKKLIRTEKRGMPCRLYYFINEDNILDLLSEPVETKVLNQLRQIDATGIDKLTQHIYIEKEEKKREEEEKAEANNQPPKIYKEIETEEVVEAVIKAIPELQHSPLLPIVCNIQKQKNNRWQGYLDFVAQTKKDNKSLFDAKAWRFWFWEDYLTEESRPANNKQFERKLTDEEKNEVRRKFGLPITN